MGSLVQAGAEKPTRLGDRRSSPLGRAGRYAKRATVGCAFTSRGRGTGFAGPQAQQPPGGQGATRSEQLWGVPSQAGAAEPALPGRRRSSPLGGRALREASNRGVCLHKPGPRNRLCRAAGAAAPLGGRALREASNRGGHYTGQTTPLSLSSASSATSCASGSKSGSQPLV